MDSNSALHVCPDAYCLLTMKTDIAMHCLHKQMQHSAFSIYHMYSTMAEPFQYALLASFAFQPCAKRQTIAFTKCVTVYAPL